ncbi:MAG: hypothetical protein K0R38_7294 [Polyangiaceae bacterium]|jgi:hypothetical protein|nr:hypothetical protein [Polyangiaceae bacterium]
MSFHRYQPSPEQKSSSMLLCMPACSVAALENVGNFEGFSGFSASRPARHIGDREGNT